MLNLENKESNSSKEISKTDSNKFYKSLNKMKKSRFVQIWVKLWNDYQRDHPNGAKFFMFLIFSIGVTIIQLLLMPILKAIFATTSLININFQIWALGQNLDGSTYFIFDFKQGTIASGGGGGLAFFLAVQITLLIAQVINFFAQRNVTFKSDGNPWKAAFWYAFAYIAITFVASLARGLYTVPIYNLLMNTWGWGAAGETVADVFTMLMYSTVSFIVFFPIFKLIFAQSQEKKALLEAKTK